MPGSARKIKTIFFIYWILLFYIIAALIWWYIALIQQNDQMAAYKTALLQAGKTIAATDYNLIALEKQRKTAQYLGEGSIFLLLIISGAIFLFRAVKKQFKITQEQHSFMMAVTHELKTPLAITKLNLETLQKRKLDESQQSRLIGNTLQEANRMNALCSNLLISSQMEAGGYKLNKESVVLNELVKVTVNDFVNRYPERKIEGNTEPPLTSSADHFLLQIAVNNLLDNAIKYTPKEGAVSISVYEHEGMNCIEVRDEGPGIKDADKRMVFEKYRRLGTAATQRAKGTGLGLYLVKRIVTALNGRIQIEDHSPKGSRFILSLPKEVC